MRIKCLHVAAFPAVFLLAAGCRLQSRETGSPPSIAGQGQFRYITLPQETADTAAILHKLQLSLAFEDETVRRQAARSAVKLAAKMLPEDTVSDLIAYIEDDPRTDLREPAWRILRESRLAEEPRAIPILVRLVKLRDAVEGGHAVWFWDEVMEQLASFGPAATAAIPNIEHALDKPACCYGVLHRSAAIALYCIDPKSEIPARALAESLSEQDLKRINSGNTTIPPELWRQTLAVVLEGLKSDKPMDRAGALSSLQSAGAAAAPVLPQVRRHLIDPDDSVKVAAALAIYAIDTARSGRDMLALLVRLLDSADDYARNCAVRALGTASKIEQHPLPELFHAANHHSADVREAVLDAIAEGKFPVEDAVFLALLDRALADRSDKVRGAAAFWYGRKFPERPGTADILRRAMQDKSAYVCRLALLCLQKHGARAAPFVADVAALLDHEEGTIRCQACRTLAAMGPAATPAVPDLRTTLQKAENTDSWALIYAARHALARLVPGFKYVVHE